MMKKLFATLAVAALALSPVGDAFAKAGSGSSLGSRGSRTADRPIQRSLTTPTSPSATSPTTPTLMLPSSGPAQPAGPPPKVQAAPPRTGVQQEQLTPGGAQPMYRPDAMRQAPGMAAPAAPVSQPGFFQRNPFMAGMMGGLIGTGIGSMLFGHSPALASASEAAPMASIFGLLLQLALFGGLAYMLFRLFRGNRAETVNPYTRPQMGAGMGSVPHVEPVLAPRVEREFEPQAADKQVFTEVLTGVQQAWSSGDLAAMRRLATPEVVSWMAEDLARNASKGLVNKVENVTLLRGDVTESWHEGSAEYVTARLTFACVDVMVRATDGSVVEGDPHRPVEHTELWTFMRERGGRWLLSAIEQE